ncbi:hypothetical protein ACLOJK_023812 [Asimina triloba]
MQKISAACAMEWSMELEKGLRSKNPGQAVDAVLQMGPKIQQWSREPPVTMAVSNMFGLVQGEDRLFANTVLLRLADAFRCGDIKMRVAVLKVFLLELKHCNKKGKNYSGIMAKDRVANYMELLKRVKIVFDTGDAKSRALALHLFGCWADFAKDSAEIRFLILSSMESTQALEVRSLSEDFACIVLEMLIKIVCKKFVRSSLNEEFVVEMLLSLTKLSLKSILLICEQVDLLLSFICDKSATLAATALRCLYTLSKRALDATTCVKILTALSRMLNNAVFSLDLQCQGLRILCKELFALVPMTFYTNCAYAYDTENICPTLPIHVEVDRLEFLKLVIGLEVAAQSPIFSKKSLSLQLLVDVSCTLKIVPRGHWDNSLGHLSASCMHLSDSFPDVALEPKGSEMETLPGRVARLVVDHITLLTKRLNGGSQEGGSKHSLTQNPHITILFEVKEELLRLFHLLLCLLREYPMLGPSILDKVRFFLEQLVNAQTVFNIEADVANGEDVSRMDIDSENPRLPCKKQESAASDLILCICKFLDTFLETLDEAGSVTSEIYKLVEFLVECIQQTNRFHPKMPLLYSLLLNSHLMWQCFRIENSMTNACKDLNELQLTSCSSKSHDDYWVDHELMTLEFTKKMVAESKHWVVYKVGKYAACQDSWFAASFAFKLLKNQAKSERFQFWLESLTYFAVAESEMRLLLFPRQGIQLMNGLQVDVDGVKVGPGDIPNADFETFKSKINTARKRISNSEKLLIGVATVDQPMYFQRWFLSLRSKVLETMIEIFELLNHDGDKITEGGQIEESISNTENMHSFVYHFTCLSFRLKKLAKEFDLLATAFMDIDCKSFRSISRLALNCSLLAFCSCFALFFPHHSASNNITKHVLEKSEKCSLVMLIEDLIERLWHVDSKTTTGLQLFLDSMGGPSGYFQSRTQISNCGHRDRASLMVCRVAVAAVISLQEEAKLVQNGKDQCHLLKAGFRLLSDIVKKWIYMPFLLPRFFFRVRPCVGAELFAFNADRHNPDKISISQGSHLSLNLCIQIKNTSPNCQISISKLYGILVIKESDRQCTEFVETKEQGLWGFQIPNTQEMVDLNEELLLHMRNEGRVMHQGVGGGKGVTKAFVGFEANERGQGFSTCLLDVSNFPEGYYRIMWQSCCVDSRGSYWSLLSMNAGPVFWIKKPSVAI